MRLDRQQISWARGRRTRIPACSERSSFGELQATVSGRYPICWRATGEGRCERGEKRESREHTRILLINRFDKQLDDALQDTDIICMRLVVRDPHEPPHLLLNVPARLDDPVVILCFFICILFMDFCMCPGHYDWVCNGTSRTYHSHSSCPTDKIS
jgi:hypothetical protein